MQYLVFQLRGALASWGEAAVGDYRATMDSPTASALSGLMCAALGLRREDEASIQAVHSGYLLSVGVYATGHMLRDYHTAQVPSRTLLKGSRHATRKDELSFRRTDLSTILSTRDHVQEVDYLICAQATEAAPFTLEALRQALERPAFVPYLGRKSCPLALPMAPRLLESSDVLAAFASYQPDPATTRANPTKLTWPDGMTAGVSPTMTVQLRDRLIHRGAWQYGQRNQHVAMLQEKA
jgi:CRISPR system Cascade subunit CasD